MSMSKKRKKCKDGGKKTEERINDSMYFWDIETSTIYTDCGYEMQIVFLSNIIKYNFETQKVEESVFHRDLTEFVEYISHLPQNTIIWSHNLDYELTFLLRHTSWNQGESMCIFRDKNAPLSVNFYEMPNITFRDSYALFGKSVAVLGDILNLPKLEYDYKKIRLPWDTLEQLDYDYNERDNLIVALSLNNYIRSRGIPLNKIPLTFTSEVRQNRMSFIQEHGGNRTLMNYYYERSIFLNLGHEIVEYFMRGYQGGLTASCKKQTAKFITQKDTTGVFGIDIKSSYPNQMTTKKFPRFEEDNLLIGDSANRVYRGRAYKHFLGTFTLTNIRIKNENYILPISSSQLSKGSATKPKFFNGKLYEAEEITIPCTNVDLDVIKKAYDYDTLYCSKIITTSKEKFLNKHEVFFLLQNFLNKEKNIEKDKSKLIINSMYGVKVSNPLKDEYTIQDGNIDVERYFGNHSDEQRKVIYENFIAELELFKGTLDVYSDGVWITSYAREQLVNMSYDIVALGGFPVYHDTDSIKMYCKDEKTLNTIKEHINNYNIKKLKDNKKLLRFRQCKEEFNVSDEDYEVISTIGIWEIEDAKPHKAFITLGAKKYGYITHDDKIKTTIAGCNKKNVPIVISNLAKKEKVSLERALKFCFSPGVTFDESASGRTTAHKETEHHLIMNDFTYQGRLINQYGGIVIKDTTYTLGITKDDSFIVGMYEVPFEVCKIDINGNVLYKGEY